MYTQPGIISSSVSSSPFFSTLSTSLVICNLYTDCTAWLRPFLSSPALCMTVCMCGGGDLKSSATQVFHAPVLFTCLSSWPASFLASNLASSLLTFIPQLKETTVCNLWCPARSSFKQVPAEPTNRKQNKVLYCSTLSQSAITMLKTLPHPWRKKGKKCTALWPGSAYGQDVGTCTILPQLTSWACADLNWAPRTELVLPDSSINCAEK